MIEWFKERADIITIAPLIWWGCFSAYGLIQIFNDWSPIAVIGLGLVTGGAFFLSLPIVELGEGGWNYTLWAWGPPIVLLIGAKVFRSEK